MVTAPICTALGLSPQLCTILYEVLFPWVLTFAVIFGLLIKSKLFGEGSDKTSRGVSGLIALAVGFFLTAFTPFGHTIGSFFINISGNLMMFLFVILGILLVLELLGTSYKPSMGGWQGLIVLIIVVLLAWVFLGGWLGGGLGFYAFFTRDAFAILIILAVIGAMWWFVGDTGKGAGKPEDKKDK